MGNELNFDCGFLAMEKFVVNEKVSAFKFANSYQILDVEGNTVGMIEQTNVSGGAKAARLLLGSAVKAAQGFTYNIRNLDGSIIAKIVRNGLSSGKNAMRTIMIMDGGGNQIAALRIVPNLWTPQLEVSNSQGDILCKISGDWKGYNFTVTDGRGDSIGTINKKWAGMAKELFTTADKYFVEVNSEVSGKDRIAICATAVAIDMILHEC